MAGAWPSQVNPGFGIAAVSLPAGSVDRTGLLGCACIDQPGGGGMSINCTIVAQSGGISWTSPVAWEVASAPQFLTCERVRVVVQSIRWPTQRVSVSGRGLSATCIADGTCLAADAAVYVIPICGGNGVNILACFPSGAFALSNCFPYCMGLRLVGDGAAQPLMMRGSASWSSGILLAQRSCQASSGASTGASLTVTQCQMSQQSLSSSSAIVGNCPYAFACSTWVSNRTAMASSGYLPAAESTAAFSLTSPMPLGGGVYVALSGQPLVVAGGVVMRMRLLRQPISGEVDYTIDFPQLVGDQYNEFTMEVGLVDGVPCAPPAPVQSMSASAERPGTVTVPPLDVDRVQWYNPATLSAGGVMWYAVNPTFTNAESFWKWCVTHQADQQCIITSEYAPIRLWRVQTNADAYCTTLPDGTSACDSGIAVGFPLNDAMALPTSGGMFLASTCLGTYDLWVESLEFYDDLNLAVSVRRGGPAAVASLYFGLHAEPRGVTVTYFVNTQNVSQVREGVPWLVADVYPKALLGTTVLCPALRMLPPVGTFVGESLASVVLLFRTPLQLLCNPFAIIEVLAARGVSCPDNTLNHGALRDCGARLFSLDDFFDSAEAASGAFWDVWAFLAYLAIEAGVPPTLTDLASGGVTYLGAAHTVSLMPVVYAIESLGAGAGVERFLSSRRLLQTDSSGGGSSGEGWGAMFSSGFSKVTDFVGGMANIAEMQVSAGANMGVLLATKDPTHMLGHWCTAPAMSWAHFIYDTGVSIFLDVASASYRGDAITWSTFANGIYEGRTSFHALVIPATQTQCEALRLMLGGSSGLALVCSESALQPTTAYLNMLFLTYFVFATAGDILQLPFRHRHGGCYVCARTDTHSEDPPF